MLANDKKVADDDHASRDLPSRSARSIISRDGKSVADQLQARPHGIASAVRDKTMARTVSVNATELHESIAADEEAYNEIDTLAVTSKSPLTSNIVDMLEDCDRVFAEDRNRLKKWRRLLLWISSRSITIAVVIASLITTLVVWVFDSSTTISQESQSKIWVWTAIPGMLAVCWVGSYLIEIGVIRLAGLLIRSPSWLFPIIQNSLSGYLRLIVFVLQSFHNLNQFIIRFMMVMVTIIGIAIDNLVVEAWMDLASLQTTRIDIAHQILQSIYVVVIGLVVKQVFNALIEMWSAEKSFGKRIKMLLFLEDVLTNLCCRTEADKRDFAKLRQNMNSKREILSDIEYIREGSIRFPLEHRGDQWVFSTESSIVVSITKDMGLVAEIIFSNIVIDHSLHTDPTNPPVVSLEIWCSYFENTVIGVHCFRLLFSRQGDAMKDRKVNKEQFTAACISILNSRSVLANRLKGFANLSSLIHTVISGIFWVIMVVVIYRIFGYEFNQLLTAISATILGAAFALSKSISRFVESVVFIFGGKPYQVNDSVSIDGNWYQVHEIALLDTFFKDRVNRLVRYSNQTLADLKIVNLTNSFGCATRIAIEICMDTPVQALEKLKASLTKYAVSKPQHWRPRVGIFLNDATKLSAIELEIRVDSEYKYIDGGSFRVADTELKYHIAKKMKKLGIRYFEPPKSIVITKMPSEAGLFSMGSSADLPPRYPKPVVAPIPTRPSQ